MIEVRPVTDRRTRRLFIDLPYEKYRGHPHWIPPARMTEVPQFDPKRNPFFADADMDLFLAWDGPAPVGRVAAIDDHRHNAALGDNVAGFGFFEADSAEAASALLAEVDRWAEGRGRTKVRGPVSPSLNHVAGLQIDAFDIDPVVMLPYNPPEYVGYVEAAGYRKAMDLLCWMVNVDTFPLERWEAIARRTERHYGVVVHSLNRWRLKSEARKLYDVYTQAWERNWGFVPPSFDEFWHIVRDLRWLSKLSGVLIAEVAGRPVAATTSVPDVNQVLKGTDGRVLPFGWWRLLNMSRVVTRTRAVTTGVVPEYRQTGVLAAMMYHLIVAARHEGFKQIELSWILEGNAAANQTISKAGGWVYKTYRLYEKPLAAGVTASVRSPA
jgi:GNAT superfamily N-acetyltransferase